MRISVRRFRTELGWWAAGTNDRFVVCEWQYLVRHDTPVDRIADCWLCTDPLTKSWTRATHDTTAIRALRLRLWVTLTGLTPPSNTRSTTYGYCFVRNWIVVERTALANYQDCFPTRTTHSSDQSRPFKTRLLSTSVVIICVSVAYDCNPSPIMPDNQCRERFYFKSRCCFALVFMVATGSSRCFSDCCSRYSILANLKGADMREERFECKPCMR